MKLDLKVVNEVCSKYGIVLHDRYVDLLERAYEVTSKTHDVETLINTCKQIGYDHGLKEDKLIDFVIELSYRLVRTIPCFETYVKME